MRLVTAQEMQRLDQAAITGFGIPGIVLMENAGRGTFQFMEREMGELNGKTVLFFIGPGNNGGDGLVIARYVHQAGGKVLLMFARDPDRLKGDAATNWSICARLGLKHDILAPELSAQDLAIKLQETVPTGKVACLVDALFGTGLSREVTGHYAEIIHSINMLHKETGVPVVAVDLPSGLDADTGEILGCAVRADLTATYGLAKPAHFHHGGKGIGKLEIIDITIPPEAVNQADIKGELLTGSVLESLPQRSVDSHKGSHGHLLVVAGSTGKTGAAILSCQAALRSGCGLVTAAVPADLNPVFEQRLVEAMTVALPASLSRLEKDDRKQILFLMQTRSAMVLGPGMGLDATTRELVHTLYRDIQAPMVVDADGLNLLAENRALLERPGGPRIFTPHPGEMARLLDIPVAEVQRDRIQAALSLCRAAGKESVVVLKGAGTVVARADGRWAVNSTGNQGMATGGMGDVLAGLLGGFLARGMRVWDAARAAVYVHGAAADLVAGNHEYGYLASEVTAALPKIICNRKVEEK